MRKTISNRIFLIISLVILIILALVSFRGIFGIVFYGGLPVSNQQIISFVSDRNITSLSTKKIDNGATVIPYVSQDASGFYAIVNKDPFDYNSISSISYMKSSVSPKNRKYSYDTEALSVIPDRGFGSYIIVVVIHDAQMQSEAKYVRVVYDNKAKDIRVENDGSAVFSSSSITKSSAYKRIEVLDTNKRTIATVALPINVEFINN